MSKEFEVLEDKKQVVCADCTYVDSCKMLKLMNAGAKENKKEPFNNRFFCAYFEKQPFSLNYKVNG